MVMHPNKDIQDLLVAEPHMMQNFVLELSDKCNLRCVYCHQSRPDFEAKRNMSEKMVAHIMEYFGNTPPPYINLVGGGDLIMAPDWHKQCTKLLDKGIPLCTTVNLGKILTQEELEVFARFSMISVSVDTTVPELLKKYRKSVDIRTITQNIIAIKSTAKRLGLPGPKWTISAVYYAEIVNMIEDVAAYAVTLGADMFSIQDLVEYDRLQNNVKSVWTLKGEAALYAVQATRKAIALARREGLQICLPGDFDQRLEQFERENHVTSQRSAA